MANSLDVVTRFVDVYLRSTSLWPIHGLANIALQEAFDRYPVKVEGVFTATASGEGSLIGLPHREVRIEECYYSNRQLWHYTQVGDHVRIDDDYLGPINVKYSFEDDLFPGVFQIAEVVCMYRSNVYSPEFLEGVRSNTVYARDYLSSDFPPTPFNLVIQGAPTWHMTDTTTRLHEGIQTRVHATCFSVGFRGLHVSYPYQPRLNPEVSGYDENAIHYVRLNYPLACAVVNDWEVPGDVILQAQANMYQIWIRQRALYDQYVGIASTQSISMDDILALVANLEMRARMANQQDVTIPKPVPAAPRRRKVCR